MSSFLDLMEEYQRELKECASKSSERLPFWHFFTAKKEAKKRQTIAFVTTHSDNNWANQAIRNTLKSLESAVGREHMPDFDIFVADLDPTKLQNKIFPHLLSNEKSYQAVVCLGTWCTMSIYEMAAISDFQVPVVFVAVDDPVSLRLVDMLEQPGGLVTGVQGIQQNYTNQVATLRAMRPDAESVILPFDPRHSNDVIARMMGRSVSALHSELERQGFDVRVLETTYKRVGIDVVPQIARNQVLCLLPDASLVSHIDLLVDHCNKNGTTLLTSELDSVHKGAAVGFGSSGSSYGPQAGRILYDLLQKNANPKNLSVRTVNLSATMRHNPATMSAQGISLSADKMRLLNTVSIHIDTI